VAGPPPAVLTAADLQDLLEASFPGGDHPKITAVTDYGAIVRLDLSSRHGRPGGTASGPTLMTLADTTAWMAILSRIGPVLLSVTTSLHIDFLRKPALNYLEADGSLLKLGRRLAVVDVTIRNGGDADPVAKAQVTYSLPSDLRTGGDRAPLEDVRIPTAGPRLADPGLTRS
jgi:uncharacterized protein (TIGR00369 family)